MLSGTSYLSGPGSLAGFPRACAAVILRLKPGGEVKLRYSYVIKCKDVVKDGLPVLPA